MRLINDRGAWNKIVLANKGQFLQSWEWGELQEKMGRKTWRVVAGGIPALLIKYSLPFGRSYLYCPGGPLISSLNKLDWKLFGGEVKEGIKNKGQVFLKIEPWGLRVNAGDVVGAGFKKSTPLQPTLVRIIDLTRSEKEILGAMEHDTRYAIRAAQKRGVVVSVAEKKEEKEKLFERFWNIFKETNERRQLKYHQKEYYKQVALLDGDCRSKIFLATVGDTAVSGAITVYFGDTVFYLYAASATGFGRYNAPTFTLWSIIKDAVAMQMTSINTGGISHIKQSMSGTTAFKKSFGGHELAYPGAWDFPFKKSWYFAYRIAKRIIG